MPPHAPPLTDSRILIVGGGAGIGLACARALLEAGAPALTLAGRSDSRGAAALETLAAAYPGAALHFARGDAGDPAQAAEITAQAVARMGGIDSLICTAGGDPMPALLKTIPVEALIPAITAVLAPIITPMRAVLPVMAAQGGGAMVAFASDAGKIPTPGESAIGAAMAAIMMFARGLAVEGKRDGVRANIVTPSIVRGTPLYDRLMADPFAGKLFGKAEQMAQLGVVEPDDLAALVAHLCSPAAAKMTGQAISMTGGISAL